MLILNKHRDKLPVGAVYVGRPSKWGNPFAIGRDGSREEVIEKYRTYALDRIAADPHWLDELYGASDLVCWCYPLPCHADVLVWLLSIFPFPACEMAL